MCPNDPTPAGFPDDVPTVGAPDLKQPVIGDIKKLVTQSTGLPIHAYQEELPSGGVLYVDKDGHPLLPDGKITLRPLTTREENILYSPGDGAKKIADIISACIVKTPFDPQELLMSDRQFLLISLRVHSFGGRYDFEITCGQCRKQNKVTVDIARDLNCEKMDPTAKEPFAVFLPDCKRTIHFRLLRGKDEAAVMSEAKRTRMRSNDNTDPSFLIRRALQLMAVDDTPITTLMEAQMFVRNMTMRDSLVWQREADKFEAGIDLKVRPSCPSCGHENELMMPFDVEFFLPTTI